MHQYNEHPFSPPSSTGSHGTVTLTSNLTLGPQGESTRRMDDVPTNAAMRNSKAPQPSALNINTSALARTFPEWSRWNPDSPEHEKDMWEIASDASPIPEEKENVTPLASPNPSVAPASKGGDYDEEVSSKKFLDRVGSQLEATKRKIQVSAEVVRELVEDIGARETRATLNARRD